MVHLRPVHASCAPLIDLTDCLALSEATQPGRAVPLDVRDEEEEAVLGTEAVADVDPPHLGQAQSLQPDVVINLQSTPSTSRASKH